MAGSGGWSGEVNSPLQTSGREESPDTVLRHVDHSRSSFIGGRQADVFNGDRRAVNGTLDRATRLITSGGRPRRVCWKAELHASACSAPTKSGCGAAELRKVPQRIDRRRSTARWHRAGKPAGRLRKARNVWQG